MLERTGGAGGAAALAEGIVYLGGGTPIQTACGFEDSLDEMLRYMMAACGPAPDEAKIAAYCESSLDHFDWLVARGVPFDPSFCAETSMAPTGEEGLVYSGGEDAYPFDRIARPAPRGHLAKTKRSTGWLLMQHLAEAAGRRGPTSPRHPGGAPGRRRRRWSGSSPAASARPWPSGPAEVSCSAPGVSCSTTRCCAATRRPLARGNYKVGTEGDDGRAIEMAQAVGAAVRNMYAGEVSLPITPPRGLIHGILVNGHGQRLHQRGHLHGPGRARPPSTPRTPRRTWWSTRRPTSPTGWG